MRVECNLLDNAQMSEEGPDR